jgi:hypothetical protein
MLYQSPYFAAQGRSVVMILELGKVTEETRDTSPIVTALDGNTFPPIVYYQVCCDPWPNTHGVALAPNA